MGNHIGEVVRVVVCAAILNTKTKEILCSPRHYDSTTHCHIKKDNSKWLKGCVIEGFVDQWGVFMTREEALDVATKAGQLNTRRTKTHPLWQLFSEDLY